MDPEEADYDVQVGQYWLTNNVEYRLTSVLVASIFLDLYVSGIE
jgi:hypothetical protein